MEFRHHNEVLRIHQDSRVTKPYSDTQWALIDAMGAAVDARLDAMDVRLTQGGEPTFVSINDMESAPWNTTALGADKLRLARDLLLRLRDRFARGGLLHHGQGKWYPGEELPRWALGCFWRGDGEPVWRDPQWLAPVGADQGHDFAAADRFAHHLCVALALDPARLLIAHEDAFTTCGVNRNCRSISILKPPRWMTVWSAAGSRACCSRGCTRRPVWCCRWAGIRLRRAGAARPGRCGAAS